jgi:transcription termination factor Rho
MQMEDLMKKTLAELRDQARALGVRNLTGKRKQDLANEILNRSAGQAPDSAAREPEPAQAGGQPRAADRAGQPESPPAGPQMRTEEPERGPEESLADAGNPEEAVRTDRGASPADESLPVQNQPLSEGIPFDENAQPENQPEPPREGTGEEPEYGTPERQEAGEQPRPPRYSRNYTYKNGNGNASNGNGSRAAAKNNFRKNEQPQSGWKPRPKSVYYNEKYATSNPAVPDMLNAGECGEAEGILDIQPDGYGFLRAIDKDKKDIYVSIAQIRRFHLRQGDHVVGKTRPEKEGERYLAMLYITSINGHDPETAARRKHFDDLVPIFPDKRLTMERHDRPNDLAIRLIDLVAPVGMGQRGMIVSPPKAGKTTLLKNIANSISANYPDIYLIVLLIDERPEEVTDMERSTRAEVVSSTFDERPENHCAVAEAVLERAKRMVEDGRTW